MPIGKYDISDPSSRATRGYVQTLSVSREQISRPGVGDLELDIFGAEMGVHCGGVTTSIMSMGSGGHNVRASHIRATSQEILSPTTGSYDGTKGDSWLQLSDQGDWPLGIMKTVELTRTQKSEGDDDI